MAAVTDGLRVLLSAAVDCFSMAWANVEWSKLLEGQRPFVLPQIYRDWIKSFLGGADFQRLRQSSVEVQLALTRPIRFLPVSVSTAPIWPWAALPKGATGHGGIATLLLQAVESGGITEARQVGQTEQKLGLQDDA